MIHNIHVFHNLTFLSVTSGVGRVGRNQGESFVKVEKVVDVVTMNAIKGTEDFTD